MEVLGEASSVCHDLSCCKKSKKEETVATQVFDQVEQGEHRRRILSQPCEPGEEALRVLVPFFSRRLRRSLAAEKRWERS